jgi:hypothetical protein
VTLPFPEDAAKARLARYSTCFKASGEALLPEDAAKARLARYRALFAAMAKTSDTVAETATSGALTPVEALAVIRRHVKRLRFDLTALDEEGPVQS